MKLRAVVMAGKNRITPPHLVTVINEFFFFFLVWHSIDFSPVRYFREYLFLRKTAHSCTKQNSELLHIHAGKPQLHTAHFKWEQIV